MKREFHLGNTVFLPFNHVMRFLRAILSLVATLVVVGSPCVSRACSMSAVSDVTVALGVECHANGSLVATSNDAEAPQHEASDVPVSPGEDEDRDASLLDGCDDDALPVHNDPALVDERTLSARIVAAVQSAPETRAPETSPRPPRV